MILPVILAGGAGKRLWPLSDSHLPKQFLSFFTDMTLLQQCLDRAHRIPDSAAPLILGNKEHEAIIAEQVQNREKPQRIILEPFQRNTAPAIAIASIYANTLPADPLLLILPSDHYIEPEAFIQAIQEGIPYAKAGHMVVFGVKPSSAHTGYGYIKWSVLKPNADIYKVDKFIEKPSKNLAQQYFQSEEYLWNAGIFLCKGSKLQEIFSLLDPNLMTMAMNAYKNAQIHDNVMELDQEWWERCPNISFDYAVMEKSTNAVVVPLAGEWKDLGNWKNIWEMSKKDAHYNVIKGQGTIVDCAHMYLHSTSKPIVAIGLQNQVIIETQDTILVCSFEKLDEIKSLIDKIES